MIRRILVVNVATDSARIAPRGGSMSWEVFDPPKFSAYLRRLADDVERAEAAGNRVPLDVPLDENGSVLKVKRSHCSHLNSVPTSAGAFCSDCGAELG